MLESQFDPSEVQYLGMPHDIDQGLLAVRTIVNSENPPRKASVATWKKDPKNRIYEHFFLFWYWDNVPLTIVRSSFISGYGGGGPHIFSESLRMVSYREIPTSVIFVCESQFNAIATRRLTAKMIDSLHAADDGSAVFPSQWVMPMHREQTEGQFWEARRSPKPDFDFLDPEISKRCRHLCTEDPETAVFLAFKIVEDRLRALVSSSNDDEEELTGGKLIARALNPNGGILTDGSLSPSEREGVFLMFKGAYMFVRNPRAHRIVDDEDGQQTVEFIYLADLLLRILPKTPSASNPGAESG